MPKRGFDDEILGLADRISEDVADEIGEETEIEIVDDVGTMGDGPTLGEEMGVFADDEREKAFATFLSDEFENEGSDAARQEYLDRIEKWKRQRIARPEKAVKDYPFPNSANITPPLTMNKVNTIYAKALSVYSLKRPFWSASTPDRAYTDHAGALANLMNEMAKNPFIINMPAVNRKALYEAISLGNQFYELSWDIEEMDVKGPDGVMMRKKKRNGPVINLLRPEALVMRPYWTDFQKAPVIGVKVLLTWGEILEYERQGRFDSVAVEAVKGSYLEALSAQRESDITRQGFETTVRNDVEVTRVFELMRFYAYWDVDGSGQYVDLTGVFDPESKALLRVERNALGWRMINKIGYFDIPGYLYSLGVCHQTEFLQDEVEMLHNQRGDNMKWSMLGMFKTRKNAGIGINEKVYPGKLWHLETMDDLQEMRFESNIEDSLKAERLTMQYADQATGANDALAGMADQTLKSGGGAQAQQILMEQGSTILNAGFDTMDEYFGEMGKLLAILIVANAHYVDLSLVGERDQQLLGEVFALDPGEIPLKFKFNVETTELERTETAKKETLAMFSQMYSGYGTEMLGLGKQLAMNAQNPMMMPIVLKLMVGKTKLLEELTGMLHVGKPETFVPNVKLMEMQLKTMEEAIDGQVGVGAGGGTNIPGMGSGDGGGPGLGGENREINGPGPAIGAVGGQPQMGPGGPGY